MNATLVENRLHCDCGLESRGDWHARKTGILTVTCACGTRWLVIGTLEDAVLIAD